jgi:hypothetical protein
LIGSEFPLLADKHSTAGQSLFHGNIEMTPRQSYSMERALGQLQGQVEAMAESVKAIAKQGQEAAVLASAERHEMLTRMAAMERQNAAMQTSIDAMKPLHDRFVRSGWIVTGILLCAGAIGGAFGSKLSVIWTAIYGAAK